MKCIITISSLVLGTCSFLALYVSDAKAEVSAQPLYRPTKLRQTSFLTSVSTRAETVNSDLSLVGKSRNAAALEQKLLKRGARWTAEEDRRLLELREQGKSWEEVHKIFPERSWIAVIARYHRLKPDAPGPTKEVNFWTEEEEKLLLELVKADISWEEMAKQLPGRTAKALRAKYRNLSGDYRVIPKNVSRRWTAEEDELVLELTRAHIPRAEQVAFFNDRTAQALRARYVILKSGGPPQGQKNQPYTVAEFELMHELRENGTSWNDIAAEYFPDRPSTGPAYAYRQYQKRKQRGKRGEDDI